MTTVRDAGASDRRVRYSIRLIHATPILPMFLIALLAAGTIKDNGFLWHVRAGSAQLASGQVITEDPFSFTMLGTPWRTQAWVLELLYAYLESWFSSLAWVNVFVFIVGAATAGIIGISIYRSTGSPVTTGFVMIGTVWLAGPYLQPRPVLVSYLLTAALVVVLQNRDRVIWLVIPIIWIWTAVHGSWVIGGGLIVLEWLRTSDQRILKSGIVALVSTFVTAHGLGVWQILLDFVEARDALALMLEWQVPDFGDIVQAPYLLLIAGVIVAAIRGKVEGRDLIVILPFLFLGMTSRRAVFPAAIVVVPWAAQALPRIRVPRSSMSSAVAGVAVAFFCAVAVSPLFAQPLGLLDPERFPSGDLQAAIGGKNAFYDNGVGGYLIYDEWPDRLVYIDDRAELYGFEGISEFKRTQDGDYRDTFERYGFDTALTKTDTVLSKRLREDGWSTVVESDDFIVFAKP